MRVLNRAHLAGVAGALAVLASVVAGNAFPRVGSSPGWGAGSMARLAPSLAADFNADGRVDRVLVVSRDRSVVRVVLSSGRQAELRLSNHVAGLAVVDFDRDTDPDIVALGADGHLHIWLNGGDGRMDSVPSSRPQDTRHGRPTIGQIRSTAERSLTYEVGGQKAASRRAWRVLPAPTLVCQAPEDSPSHLAFCALEQVSPRAPPRLTAA